MKNLIIICISIIWSVAIIWGQSTSVPCDSVNSQAEVEKCGASSEMFQFCVKYNSIKLKASEGISVQLILQNLSNEAVTVTYGAIDKTYEIKIYDPKGNQVLSKLEKLEEKIRDGKASVDEQISSLPINSSPRTISISPKGELNISFNLSNFYDFTEKGKYKIEISRKMPNKNGTGTSLLSADAIEIEIE
jgi:hypothetical protein